MGSVALTEDEDILEKLNWIFQDFWDIIHNSIIPLSGRGDNLFKERRRDKVRDRLEKRVGLEKEKERLMHINQIENF